MDCTKDWVRRYERHEDSGPMPEEVYEMEVPVSRRKQN
jgi:hypothetical protein